MSLQSLDLDESDQNEFGPALSKLRLDRLPAFATSVRSSSHNSGGTKSLDNKPHSVDCEVLPKVSCGSYHAVVTLSFMDGHYWVLKVPAKGHKEHWNSPLALALESEAETMRLLRARTTIPVPEVFAFNSSLDNELGCPFILMEKIPGKPLQFGWFDTKSSRAKVNQFRLRALQGIAEAMVQLNKFSFNQSGAPIYRGGVLSDIGARHVADFNALFYRDYNSADDYGIPFSDVGPFADINSYFLSALDQREGQAERHVLERGARTLLRHFIEWGQADEITTQENSFVLAHPDLSAQNIFTMEDGTLSGIIDWDWVAAVPHSVGCQKFPEFLMADYDPDSYEFDTKTGMALNDSGECSPAELSCYRGMYAQAIERLAGKPAADVTRKSSVISSLEVAATMPMTTLRMVRHLFKEIERLTSEGMEEDSETESEASEDSEEDPVNNMSFEELVKELEKLAEQGPTNSPVRISNSDESGKETISTDSIRNPQTDYLTWRATTSSKRPSRGRRLGRFACSWGAKKCRNIAQRLHRPDLSDNVSQEQVRSTPVRVDRPRSYRAKAAQAVYRQTQSMLQRAILSLHSNQDLVTSASDANMSGSTLKAISRWLRKKLDQILQLLHLMVPEQECPLAMNSKSQCNEVDHKILEGKGKSNRAKIDACMSIAGMLQEHTSIMLSEYARQAFARWMVNSLRLEQSLEKDSEKPSLDQVLVQTCREEALKRASRIAAAKETQDSEKDTLDVCKNEGYRSSNRTQDIVWDAELQSSWDLTSLHDGKAQNPAFMDADNDNLSISCFDLIFPCHNRAEGFVPVTNDADGDHAILQDDEKDNNAIKAEPMAYKPNNVGGALHPGPGTENDSASAGISIGEHDDESIKCGKSEADSSNKDDDDKDVTDIITLSGRDSDVGAIYDDYMNDGKSDGEDIGEKHEAHVIDPKKEEEEDEEEKEDSDHGTFTMFDVCIALSNGALDEQRMDRLKTGFFALLNQTL